MKIKSGWSEAVGESGRVKHRGGQWQCIL